MDGSDVVCLEGLDRRALQGLRKTMNKRKHVRRSPGRDSNGGLPKTEHECCRLRGVVTRQITFLLFTTSRSRTSTPLNLMFNGYKSSSAKKKSPDPLQLFQRYPRLSLRWQPDVTDCRCKQGFCFIRNTAFQRLVYLANVPTTLHAQGAKRMQI